MGLGLSQGLNSNWANRVSLASASVFAPYLSNSCCTVSGDLGASTMLQELPSRLVVRILIHLMRRREVPSLRL